MRNRFALLGGFVAATFAVILFGRLIGQLTAPAGPIPEDEVQRLLRSLEEPQAPQLPETATRAQAGIYVGIGDSAHLDTVLAELDLAHRAGVRRFFFEVSLDFSGTKTYEGLLSVLQRAPAGERYLVVRLDPGDGWLVENPDDAAVADAAGRRFASIASHRWAESGSAALGQLSEILRSNGVQVSAVVLSALEDGRWSRSSGSDGSIAMDSAYQDWLRAAYDNTEQLAETWELDAPTDFEELVLPEDPALVEEFALSPQHADFAEFLSGMTKATIARFLDGARTAFGEQTSLWLRYGDTLDRPGYTDTQWLIASDELLGEIDGVVLSLSNVNRGAGMPIGPSSAVHSLNLRGIPWFVLDDTRTGVSWDVSTGTVNRPIGFDIDVLLPIFDRNAAVAAMAGGGILWADLEGRGNLYDATLMEAFGERLPILYELQRSFDPSVETGISVVVDPYSSRRTGPANAAYLSAMESIRSATQQAGIAANYVYLEDLLQGRAPETAIAIFPNLYHVDVETVDALHAYLEEHGIAAIWLYAPGASAGETQADGISYLTRMNVQVFENTPPGDSVSILAGNWIQENETTTDSAPPVPSFYIDDPETDVLARYGESESASIGMRFMESGWASIYVSTPGITPSMLKEILEILDHAPSQRPGRIGASDLVVARGEYVLLHGDETGDRNFELDARYDVSDLLDETALWPNKRVLTVRLESGATRLLRLTPSEAAADTVPDGEAPPEPPEIAETVIPDDDEN